MHSMFLPGLDGVSICAYSCELDCISGRAICCAQPFCQNRGVFFLGLYCVSGLGISCAQPLCQHRRVLVTGAGC